MCFMLTKKPDAFLLQSWLIQEFNYDFCQTILKIKLLWAKFFKYEYIKI